jgi:hypothetical protein
LDISHQFIFADFHPEDPETLRSGIAVAIVMECGKKKISVDQVKRQNKDPDRRGDRNYRNRVDMNRPPVITIVIIDQPGR